MNNVKLITIIGWKTLRRKINKYFRQCCLNYGLCNFANNLYLGYLSQKERYAVHNLLDRIFNNPTLIFFLFSPYVQPVTIPVKSVSLTKSNTTIQTSK